MNILLRIQQNYNSLTKKERYVADYILKERANIKNINISILARETQVSVGTITKVAKKLGYGNFVEMKLAIAKLDNENQGKHGGKFKDVYEFYSETIDRSNEIIKQSTLEKVIERINQARTIHIYGIGSSGLTAMELQYRLARLGYQVQADKEYHQMIINSSVLSKQDLVIVLSISGETKEIVEAMKVAKTRNCHTIAFTGSSDSPVAKEADFHVPVVNAEFVKEERFINNQFSVLYVIDILFMLLLEDEERYENYSRTIRHIVERTHVNAYRE